MPGMSATLRPLRRSTGQSGTFSTTRAADHPCPQHLRPPAEQRPPAGDRGNLLSAASRHPTLRAELLVTRLGPVLGHPAGDRPLVTLDGAAGGTQQPVVQPV